MIQKRFGNGIIFLKKGDITKERTNSIVNAANSGLMGGGGVDGAIHRAGGKEILNECMEIVKTIGRLPTGKAVITTAGKLPSKYVIHTVGPIWQGGKNNEPKKLEDCYRESLELAEKYNLKTIAFPSISTGAYRYPVEKAASVAVGAIVSFLRGEHGSLEKVYVVLFDDETLAVYENALEKEE